MSTIDLKASPKTLAKIRVSVREMLRNGCDAEKIRVTLEDGIYDPENFSFTKDDCSEKTKVVYSGTRGALVHGGVTVSRKTWLSPDPAMASRFSPDALPHIRMISLSSLGLTRADWGEEIAQGGFNTAYKYDDAPKGAGSEFFCGGTKDGAVWNRRMIKARYPNLGQYEKLEDVKDVGDMWEFPPQNYASDWRNRRNHRGGCYVIDERTNERVKRWQDPSTAWMFGYFYWDWADSSTPITVDPEKREVRPKFVSAYGARAGALYYLYNVPEELDTEGEWYLDRETGNLYFWPWENADRADFSCFSKPLLSCTDTENMEFSGFSLECGVAGAIFAQGQNMLFSDLSIRNIRETAVVLKGYGNILQNSELMYLGSGGVSLSGGEKATLTHGDNRAQNNLIYDFAKVNQTRAPGIELLGVGNTASHNEICETPHMAIYYEGNEHLIEYNYIHEVVNMSHDAGAIYGGRDVTAHGTVIRYNRLKNVGNEEFHPEGIYWDDALSGQTAVGNIIEHVGHWGIEIGGGRENVVKNNLFVDCRTSAIRFDERLREGYLRGGWYKHAKEHIRQLCDCPRDTALWRAKYPLLAKVRTDDVCDHDDIDFFCNPSYGTVKNNIAVSCSELCSVEEAAYRFSDVSDNFIYGSAKDALWDEETGELCADGPVYREHPEFLPIPTEKIGRKCVGDKSRK